MKVPFLSQALGFFDTEREGRCRRVFRLESQILYALLCFLPRNLHSFYTTFRVDQENLIVCFRLFDGCKLVVLQLQLFP